MTAHHTQEKDNGTVKRIGLLTRASLRNGSTRVRALQYVPHLERYGFSVRTLSRDRLDQIGRRWLYVVRALALARWADVILLQKPNQAPRLVDLIHTANSRIIVDVDDAVWRPPPARSSQGEDRVSKEFGRRLRHAAMKAGSVIAGNRYIAGWMREECRIEDVTVIPSVIDLDQYVRIKSHRKEQGRTPTIGWIGSTSNLVDLEVALPALSKLQSEGRATLHIISGRRVDLGIDYQFKTWSLEDEISYLLELDVGIMPLGSDSRSLGRCAYKAIQYMALGIPVVASPVGAALDAIEHGSNGFHAASAHDWYQQLSALVESSELRGRLGKEGRRTVEAKYCVQRTTPMLVESLRRRAAAASSPK